MNNLFDEVPLDYRDVHGTELPDFDAYDWPTIAVDRCSRDTIARLAANEVGDAV